MNCFLIYFSAYIFVIVSFKTSDIITINSDNNELIELFASVYSVFDALGLSFGPYLWTTVICGLVSGVLIVIKACLVMASSTLESPSSESRGFQHPWSMLEMLLLFIALAPGHIVVAYRTRCKARRKMLHFHQLDPEVVRFSLMVK